MTLMPHREPENYEAMRRACAVAQWQLGSESWASVRGRGKGWTTKYATARLWPTVRARRYAKKLARELNAEDEAWLASL